MSKEKKGSTYAFEKIKTWFRARKWSAINCLGGFYLESPIDAEYGKLHREIRQDGEGSISYHLEHRLTIQNGVFTGSNMLNVEVYERKCYYKDVNRPIDKSSYLLYARVPSDNYSDWKKVGNCRIQAATILKLAELIKENQKICDNLDLDSYKNFPSKFLSVPSDTYLIDVNCSREQLNYHFSNRRLRDERRKNNK